MWLILETWRYIYIYILTHLPQVPHICDSELGQHWFRQWLVACSAPSHYLNQCWLIVNWTLRNKLQWNLNQNTKLFIYENAFENAVCEMAAILSRGRWVKMYAWKSLTHLCPNDIIWRHRNGPTLAQVIACCLMAPNHYLNQCWFIISEVQLQSPEGNFTRDVLMIDW